MSKPAGVTPSKVVGTKNKPLVSVVVPCYNSEEHIEEMLLSLVRQTISEPWEVVIADNGTTDSSIELALQYKKRLPLRIIDASGVRGVSHARNRGMEEARGEFVLFCDTDDVRHEQYVEAMTEALKEHPFVGGHIRYEHVNPDWAQGQESEDVNEDGLGATHHLPFIAGGVLGIHRDICLALGGFDEKLKRMQDMDFGWRVQQELGIKPVWVEDAKVYVRGRSLASAMRSNFISARYYGHIHEMHGMRSKITNDNTSFYVRHELKKLLIELLDSFSSRSKFNRWMLRTAWNLGVIFQMLTSKQIIK